MRTADFILKFTVPEDDPLNAAMRDEPLSDSFKFRKCGTNGIEIVVRKPSIPLVLALQLALLSYLNHNSWFLSSVGLQRIGLDRNQSSYSQSQHRQKLVMMDNEYQQETKLKHLIHLVQASEDLPLDRLKQELNEEDGPSVLAAHRSNDTLLHSVCAHSNVTLEAVQWLVGLYPNAVRHQTYRRGTPLHEACFNDYVPNEVVEYLIDVFPEALNLVENQHGFTPLACALDRTTGRRPISIDLVNLLIEKDPKAVKIKIEMSNYEQGETTVIHFACLQETVTVELMKILLEQWPGCLSVRARGMLPFHALFSERSCRRKTSKELVGYLLSRYPAAIQELVLEGEWCGLPLHMACKKGESLDIIQFLGDVYPPAYQSKLSGDTFSAGNSPLHEYLRGNPDVDLEVVRHLVEKFPESVGIFNSSGCLPHQYALSAGVGVIKYLLERNPTAARDQKFFDGIMMGADPETIRYVLELFPEGMTANGCKFGTMLHRACGNKQHTSFLDRLEFIFDLCPEAIKVANAQGNLPLHVACERYCGRQTADGIGLLLSKYPGAARMQNNQGMTCLHLLYQNFYNFLFARQPDAINIAAGLLIAAYPEAVKIVDHEGRLPIHHACQNKHSLETIKHLVDLYPHSVQVVSPRHGLPIHLLSKSGNTIHTLQYLMRKSKKTLDTHVQGIGLPLHCACRAGQKDFFNLLLARRYPDQGLPLHAILQDDELLEKESIVQYILSEYRWSLRNRDSQGAMPLHIAVASDVGMRTVQKLLELDPDLVSQKDKSGFLPLHYALRRGDPSNVVEMLLDRYPGAVKIAGVDNLLPLHFACRKGVDLEIGKRMVRIYPGSVGITDSMGELPLHKACRAGHWELVEFLVDEDGRSLRQANREGKLPAFLLLERSRKQPLRSNEAMELGTIFRILRMHPEAIL
jgi:ankyrin repeat protein